MNIYVGQMLYGYCNGYFGSSYGDKRIEAFGVDWMIAREDDGSVVYSLFDSLAEMEQMVEENSEDLSDFEELLT